MVVVLVTLFLTSFIGSFIFAGFETGFISWNSLKIEHRAQQGRSRSQMAMILQRNSAMLITTVLIGNNIALVGMALSLENLLASVPVLNSEIFQNAFLTVTALIFCELLPKSLFRIYSFKLTMRFVPPVTGLFYLFSPISKLISLLTGGGREAFSRKEAMAAIAMEGGRHKLFSPIFGEVVDRVVSNEHTHIGALTKSLAAVALKHTSGEWDSSTGITTAEIEQGVIFNASDTLSAVISHKGFLSQEYFTVKDGDQFLCYKQQDVFEKFFLFADKD